jgi:FdhD protein
MGGEISYFHFSRKRNRLNEGPGVSMTMVQSLMKKTLAMAGEYRRTGGIHCASLASVGQGRILIIYEDIGRHKAVDKVVGRMLLTQ